MKQTILLPPGLPRYKSDPILIPAGQRRTIGLYAGSDDLPLDAQVSICSRTPGADITFAHLTHASPIAQLEGELEFFVDRPERGPPAKAVGVYMQEAFTPARFGSSLQAWYEPADMSTLFQDSAGTIPVTAFGQPVGLMRDKSGLEHHLSQKTATARPVLIRDDAGFACLQFDNIDDALQSTTFAASGAHQTIAAAMRLLAGAPDYAPAVSMVHTNGARLMLQKHKDILRMMGRVDTPALSNQTVYYPVYTPAQPFDGATHVARFTVHAQQELALNRITRAVALTGTANPAEAGTFAIGKCANFYGAVLVRDGAPPVHFENLTNYLAEISGAKL